MAEIIPLSITSIKIVETELNASLQEASRHFEAYMEDRNVMDQLNESRSKMTDILGVLKLLQIPGAIDLAQEMVVVLNALVEQPTKANDFLLSSLSHAFVAMPCYLEYVLDRQQAIPALTLVFVNELRTARREAILFESQLSSFSVSQPIDLAGEGDNSVDKALLTRLRQMYQIGLIGLIREDNLKLKLQLMHRAMQRLAEKSGNAAIRGQWLLSEAVLEALLSGDLALNFTRKRCLALMDAQLRQAEQTQGNELTASQALLTELAYLVNVARCSHKANQEVSQRLALKAPAVSDKQIQRERHIMQGPNMQTIQVMVSTLKEELAQSKEQLEVAAQDSHSAIDFNEMAHSFQRTADILSVIGLSSPGAVLKQTSEIVRTWVSNSYNKEQLLIVADNLLYIDSALNNLTRFDLNFKGQLDDDSSKQAMMAKSQLGEAKAIVLQEAQAGIGEAKKAINSFVEAQFDKSYLDTVLESLVTVRGGVNVLAYAKASAILQKSIEYIKANVEKSFDENSAQSLLDTMADTLISLEYYLSEVQLHGSAPDAILLIAEKSLEAVGYSI